MGDLKGYFCLPILLLVAMWGLLETILKVSDRLNEIRNTICMAGTEDSPVSVPLAKHMVWADWLPLLVVLVLAIFLLGVGFACMPRAFAHGHEKATGEAKAWGEAILHPVVFGLSYLNLTCFRLAFLSFAVVVAHVVCSSDDLFFMLDTLARHDEVLVPVRKAHR